MTIDWTAALVLLTGFIALCGGNLALMRLVVRDELRKADLMPRDEANRRIAAVETKLRAY